MKYFISSDIHSFYDEWMKALNEAGFDRDNKDHSIIVLGDLLDRGEKPLECLKFVNSLYKEGRAILIRGNHEDLLEQLLTSRYPEAHDIHNGTWDTVECLAGMSAGDCCSPQKVYAVIDKAKENKELKKYLKSVIDYAELGDNIFVHGWIPLTIDNKDLDYSLRELAYLKYDLHCYDNWRETGDWEEARWLNGMFHWSNGDYEKGKTIWCGHWNSSWGHSVLHHDGVQFVERYETLSIDPDTGKTVPYAKHTPFKDEGIVAMDACTAHSGIVNIEVLEI